MEHCVRRHRSEATGYAVSGVHIGRYDATKNNVTSGDGALDFPKSLLRRRPLSHSIADCSLEEDVNDVDGQ